MADELCQFMGIVVGKCALSCGAAFHARHAWVEIKVADCESFDCGTGCNGAAFGFIEKCGYVAAESRRRHDGKDQGRIVLLHEMYIEKGCANLRTLCMRGILEFSVLGSARERNHIADVGHSGDEQHKAFKSETEA